MLGSRDFVVAKPDKELGAIDLPVIFHVRRFICHDRNAHFFKKFRPSRAVINPAPVESGHVFGIADDEFPLRGNPLECKVVAMLGREFCHAFLVFIREDAAIELPPLDGIQDLIQAKACVVPDGAEQPMLHARDEWRINSDNSAHVLNVGLRFKCLTTRTAGR